MNVRVILKDFQQTKYADINLSEGLTIIKGTNLQGKSTLRRAFEAVIFNNPRRVKNYIRVGAKQCSVEIYVEGFLPIIWTKTTKETTYKIGNKLHTQAGRLCLDDVYPDHPFTIFDNSLLFNIISQGDKPIPFGQSSSQVFGIFEELYGILSTKEDTKKFNTKLSEYNTQLQSNHQQIIQLQNKLKVIKYLKRDIDISKLQGIKQRLQNIDTTLKQISKIKELSTILSSFELTSVPLDLITFEKYIHILQQIKQAKELKTILESKPQVELPISLDIFIEYQNLTEAIRLHTALQNVSVQRTNLIQEIDEIKKSLPVCPTCNRPLRNINES